MRKQRASLICGIVGMLLLPLFLFLANTLLTDVLRTLPDLLMQSLGFGSLLGTLVLSILAIVFAAKSLKEKKGRGMAIAGLVLGILGCLEILTLIVEVIIFIFTPRLLNG